MTCGGEPSRTLAWQAPGNRPPPPQGPVQDKFDQMEEKFTAMIQEVRSGYRQDLEETQKATQAQVKERKKSTEEQIDAIRREQQEASRDLKDITNQLQANTTAKIQSLDQNMTSGFKGLMEELHRMKRSASPSRMPTSLNPRKTEAHRR